MASAIANVAGFAPRNRTRALAGPSTVSLGSGDTKYGDMLGQIQQQEQQFYTDAYRPLARKLVDSVNSTELVDTAKRTTGTYSAERTAARGARQLARMGIQASARDSDMNAYNARLGNVALTDGTINQSRVDQQQRNDALRTDLVNISRGIASSATDSAINAAQAEGNRNNANANISAQNKAARNNTTGQLAGMALTALLLM